MLLVKHPLEGFVLNFWLVKWDCPAVMHMQIEILFISDSELNTVFNNWTVACENVSSGIYGHRKYRSACASTQSVRTFSVREQNHWIL